MVENSVICDKCMSYCASRQEGASCINGSNLRCVVELEPIIENRNREIQFYLFKRYTDFILVYT